MREMLLSNTSRNGDIKTIIVRSLVKRSIRNSGMKHCDVLQGRVSRCTLLNKIDGRGDGARISQSVFLRILRTVLFEKHGHNYHSKSEYCWI